MATPGLSIHLPIDPLVQLTKEAQVQLAAEQSDILDIMGTMLLGQIQEAYKVKARGGTAEDGIAWAPIQIRTLLARMRRAGHIKKVKQRPAGSERRPRPIFKIAKSNAENNKAFSQMAKQGAINPLSGGRGTRRFRKGATFSVNSTAKEKKRDRQTISPAAGGYEIGVDSGLQINTLQPGKPGNKTIQGNAVIIGAAMEYSEKFDADRPIIPETLPDIWIEELEDEAARFADEIIGAVFGRNG